MKVLINVIMLLQRKIRNGEKSSPQSKLSRFRSQVHQKTKTGFYRRGDNFNQIESVFKKPNLISLFFYMCLDLA